MFTNEERERIMREARETLARRYEPAPPPVEQANRTRLPPIEFEDPLRRWQREADVAARERESADAERKRQEREDERRRGANWWAAVDAHIERRLAEQRDSVSELARGTVEFANAVQDRLLAMEKLLDQLSTKLTELRAIDDQHRVIDLPSPLRPRSVN